MEPPKIHYVGADELPATADLVVVGGGIAGCAAAFFAARAGLSVVVLERRPRLGTLTTAAATGAFRLQFDNPDEIELVREGVELYGEFGLRTGLDGWSIGLRTQGYLFCSLTEPALRRAHDLVERQRSWGLTDVELLTGDEARARFPYLSADVLGARYRARDGFLDQLRLLAGYAAAASNPGGIPDGTPGPGACFATGVDVVGLVPSGDAEKGGRSAAKGARPTASGDRLDGVGGVRTSHGTISAGAVLIAAGPFSGEIASLAGLRLEIRPTVRQKVVFPVLAEVPADAPMTIEDESGAHWRPALGGCFALWTDPAAVAGQPRDPVPPDPSFAFGLLDPSSGHALARLAPFWREVWERGSDSWFVQAGQYEYTPDRRPYIGPTAVAGLYVNAGFSGHGVMASAGAARLAVALMTGRAEAATNTFRPDRPLREAEPDVL